MLKVSAIALWNYNYCVIFSLKSTPMPGFLGTFSVNFEIPDCRGIRKSVSRGFGTVKPS
ncbi:MAG: CRISPR-associated endonuclease Cas6 [Nitrospirota bacterium]